jgi:hypothetical protein
MEDVRPHVRAPVCAGGRGGHCYVMILVKASTDASAVPHLQSGCRRVMIGSTRFNQVQPGSTRFNQGLNPGSLPHLTHSAVAQRVVGASERPLPCLGRGGK